MTATPSSSLSRRALFGIGGSALLAASALTAWRWRMSHAEAATQSDGSIPYADHDGWMVSLAEKRALQARAGEPAGAPL